MKRRKVLKAVIIIAVLLIVCCTLYFIRYKKKKGSDSLQMTFAQVEKGELIVSISATGVVTPRLKADITPEAEQRGAKIMRLLIDEGDFVKKGQVVVELDRSQSLARLKSAEANLKAAQAQLELLLEGSREEEIKKAEAAYASVKSKYLQAQQDYLRTKELYEQGAVPQKELDSAKTNLEIAENNLKEAELQLQIIKTSSREKEIARQKAIVEQAKANYELAKAEYESALIYAPISGVVTNRLMEEGQIVYPGSVIAKIADLDSLEVIADVDETDIGKVKIGDEAEIYVEALGGKKIKGKVEKISSEAKVKQNITYFEVTIKFLDKEKGLKPGMTADVNIIVDKSPPAYLVPASAVKRTRDGGYEVLVADIKYKSEQDRGYKDRRYREDTFSIDSASLKRSRFIPRKVEVAFRSANQVAITDGVKEGDIIVANYALLREEKDKRPRVFGTPIGPQRRPSEATRGRTRGTGTSPRGFPPP